MSNGGPDRGYVLHSYPYKETSLILQLFTEHQGRFGAVAKGARRPKSASRAVLVPFQPLSLSWFGRGELKTLKAGEPDGPAFPLAGAALLAAFYLNELLLKLTHRDDPHPGLYAAYHEAISELRALSRSRTKPAADAVEPVLRRFEVRLLRELGYALELAREGESHVPIAAEREYFYYVERGAVPAPSHEEPRANAVKLRGLTLQHLERGELTDPVTATQAKQLMRLILHHVLNGEELSTRNLARDLQRIDPKRTEEAKR
ncbi:DNA repair protein RecO [Betaproteobacteria bacterium GR16-43]|nr:DNA repair protein RecO [Betaproteobacteria bacterium GR16-43]